MSSRAVHARRIGALVALALIAAVLPACAARRAGGDDAALQRFAFDRPLMGTNVRILLYASDEIVANVAADAAYAEAERLNGILSDYDRRSELSRLSDGAPHPVAVPVSPELFDVLGRSEAWYYRSGGAFDVTIGPVVRLWRRARRLQQMPRPQDLAEARAAVGFDKVVLDPVTRTVRLAAPGMRLDLGGIAKGYIADRMLEAMKPHGVTRALIDAGGDIVLGGPPPDSAGWTVGLLPLPAGQELSRAITPPKPRGEAPEPRGSLVDRAAPDDEQHPRDPAPSQPVYVTLAHAAVATSGDAFQHVVLDGRRYSHIVDPATGLGLTTQLAASVIVRATPTHPHPGSAADALASAVNVLGPDRALDLVARTPGAAALILQNRAGQLDVHRSPNLTDLLTPMP